MPAPKGHPPYNINGEGGRPKIYTKEFVDNEAEALNEWMRNSTKEDSRLFIEDFCWTRNYHDTRIPEFVKISERFSHVYSMFKMRQKSALFKGGLSKKVAFPMCALILSNNHGIIPKSEQKITGDSVHPLHCIIDKIDGESKDLIYDGR